MIVSVGLMGVSSCSPELTRMCAGEFSSYENRLETARVALQDYAPSLPNGAGHLEPSRALASASARQLLPEDREYWTKWTRDLLKESQHYLDRALESPDSRIVQRELSLLSQNLVRFHALADQGRVDEMIASLSEIRHHAVRARAHVCPKS